MTSLLRERGFKPFFWTQFLGAFTDNVFKNALVVMFVAATANEESGGLLITLAQGLFILPFFLFSPLAGQVCEYFSKTKVIRLIKAIEILIMILAFVGFYWKHQGFLLLVLFLMGTQSTFFGPAKFSIIPEMLPASDVMKGTGLVEMGTFVAILVGTVLGGALAPIAEGTSQTLILGTTLVLLSTAGYWFSRRIPPMSKKGSRGSIALNPLPEIAALYRLSRQRASVFNSIIGISWFWFFGAALLSLFPNLVKFLIHGEETIITLFLAMFTISIGVGSALCEKLSHSDIEIGLVPFGGIGMTIFAVHLGLFDFNIFMADGVTLSQFYSNSQAWPILVDLFLIGFFGSLFIVPLYALIQTRSPEGTCSRMIAANNIANALFMVVSAGFLMLLYSLGFTSAAILVWLGVLNLLVCVYILIIVPEFALRFGVWLMAKTIYRLSYSGRQNIPPEGPGIVVANHISFIDWFIISASCQRPVRFVMHYSFYRIPVVRWLFKIAGVIPIAQEKEDPQVKLQAFQQMEQALRDGDFLCIFPEGAVSSDGRLAPFRGGVEQVLAKMPVPVYPLAIQGVWGSFFSRAKRPGKLAFPKPSWRKIKVGIGEPIDPENVTAAELQKMIQSMLDELEAT